MTTAGRAADSAPGYRRRAPTRHRRNQRERRRRARARSRILPSPVSSGRERFDTHVGLVGRAEPDDVAQGPKGPFSLRPRIPPDAFHDAPAVEPRSRRSAGGLGNPERRPGLAASPHAFATRDVIGARPERDGWISFRLRGPRTCGSAITISTWQLGGDHDVSRAHRDTFENFDCPTPLGLGNSDPISDDRTMIKLCRRNVCSAYCN